MSGLKVRTSLTMRDKDRYLITTEDHQFCIDFRTGSVEQRDPNGYLVPLLDDPSLRVERIDWLQLGRTAKILLSRPSDDGNGIKHVAQTTGRVLSIVSDRQSRSVLNRERLGRDALGDTYSTEAMWELLGVGSKQLRSMVADAQVLQVTGALGETGFPVFQVDVDGSLLPGLGDVLCELATGTDDPWTWCTSRPAWANGRAVWELLRDGRTDAVIRAAGRAAWTWRQ